jgi:hypothetical protein
VACQLVVAVYLGGRDELDTPIPCCVGGLVGRCLVAKKSKEQYTGYFVGDADPQTASVFRDLGGDVDDQIARAADLIESVCGSDDDREAALAAASEAIQAAYDEYTESLESMGVNPKPVC